MSNASISGGDVHVGYALDLNSLTRQLKLGEQLAAASAAKLQASLGKLTALSQGGGAPGQQQATSTQLAARAQQAQAATAQRLAQLNERLQQSQLRLSLAQNTGAARVQVLRQEYDRLNAATKPLVLSTEELTKRRIAATNAATRLQQAENQLNRNAAVLPRSFAGFTKDGALQAAGAAGLITSVDQLIGSLRELADQGQRVQVQLDGTRASLGALLGSQERANQVFADATQFGDRYRLTQEEIARALQASSQIIRTSTSPVEDLLSVLARLQLVSPEQSLDEAALALKELAGGDIQSLRERFEISGDAAREMKEEIAGGADAVQVLGRYLDSIGVTDGTLEAGLSGAARQQRDYNKAVEELGLTVNDVVTSTGWRDFWTRLIQDTSSEIKFLQDVAKAIDDIGEKSAQHPGVDLLNRLDDYVQNQFNTKVLEPYQEALRKTLGVGQAELTAALDRQADAHERNAAAARANAAALTTVSSATSTATSAATAYASALAGIRQGQLNQLEAQLAANEDAMARQQLAIRQAEAALRPYEEAVKSAADAVENQRDAIERAEAALQPYRDRVEAAADAVQAQRDAIDAAERALRPWQQALESANEAVAAQERALEEAEEGLQGYRDAIDEAQQAVDAQQRKIDEAERALRPYEQAVRDAERAVRDQADALKEAEKSLEPYRDAVEAAQRAVDEQERALAQAERGLKPYRLAVQAAEDAVAAQQKRIQEAERSLRPFEDALRRAEAAEQDQERAIQAAERALAPYRAAVEDATRQVDEQQRAIERAERALRPYEQAVEASRAALEKQQAVTDSFKESLDSQTAALEDAKRQQQEWANVPLQGSRAFSDKLFEIDQQTAALQLRLLDLRIGKKDGKPSPLEEELGKVNDQVQATALHLGELRATGASDAAIKDAEAQYQALRDQQDKLSTRLAQQKPEDDPHIKALEQQLEDLATEAEKTRLDEKLKLDPLRRQLEQLGKPLEELSFEDIVKGFQDTQAEIDRLTPQVNAAQSAWEREQTLLDEATAAHQRNEEALKLQEAAIEPLRAELQRYQDALQAANDRLAEQDATIDPLRSKLEGLKEATQTARDALERQRETIQPLREQLEGLQGNLDNARTALENADRALDPMREHLGDLKVSLDDAKVALADADRALDPMREHLGDLQEAADKANRELADQQALIQPLRDELLNLQDDLGNAQRAYEDADRALDPMRAHLDDLRDGARDAALALAEQEKAIKPLRERLAELETAYKNANRALEDQDAAIDPLRTKLGLLEKSHDDARKALDNQREKIDPLRRKLDDLGLTHDALKLKVDDARKALKDAETQLELTAAGVATQTGKIARSVEDTFGTDDTSGIRAIVGNASDRMLEMQQRAWGMNNTGGIWGTVESASQGIYGSVQWLSNGLIGENGLIPGISRSGSSGFGDLSTQSVGHIEAMVSGEPTGIFGLMQDLSTKLIGEHGLIPGIRTDGASGFGGLKTDAIGHITEMIGDWKQDGGGILGGVHGLWSTLTGKADTLKNALLSPFEGAGSAISGVMIGFGNTVITGLNAVLAKIGDFSINVAKSINWIAGHIIGSDVLPTDFSAPQIPLIPMPKSDDPGLAVGTNNWRGGWARTGERGEELAILPGGSTKGNPTFLPKGTRVLPNHMLERGQGPEADHTKTAEPDPWSLIPQSVLDVVEFIRNGPLRIEQAFERLGFLPSLGLGNAFEAWDEPMRRNLMGFGGKKVFDVASEWLRSVLPDILSGPIVRGLQGGLNRWMGRTAGPQAPDTPPETPPDLPPVAGNYPTGIGLNAAMRAIIDGAYLTQGFSARHPGIDIGAGGWAAEGKPLRALFGGTVLTGGYRPSLEGQYLIIDDHGRQAYYGHMVQGSQRYEPGAMVSRGSVLGGMGATGLADAPHVHFELRQNGRSVNPLDVFSGALKFKNGGIINEPVFGWGRSGQSYVFGDGGRPELVLGGDTLDRLASVLDHLSRRDDIASRLDLSDRQERSRGGVHIDRFEAHYKTYESERDLQSTVWKLDQLYGDR